MGYHALHCIYIPLITIMYIYNIYLYDYICKCIYKYKHMGYHALHCIYISMNHNYVYIFI